MSKISEYLDAVRNHYAQYEVECESDPGTDSGGREIVVEAETESVTLLRAVASRVNGAEWDALTKLTDCVIWGLDIDPDLQRLVNLIVAKSLVQGGLPSMKRGRPKSDETEQLGRDVAQAYWDLRDEGTPYAEAVATVSERFHKDERHIMRMVKAHTEEVGATFERRAMWRRWAEAMRLIYSAEGDNQPKRSVYETILEGSKLPLELEMPEFEDEDYLDHLDELIRKEADAKPLLTRKIRVLRPVTQRD